MTTALSPAQIVFNNPSTPLGWLYFYLAGTTTPQAAYSDSTGSTPLANPLQLDSNGQATFWLKSGLSYKINLVDVNLYQQTHCPVDNILADPANGVYVTLAALAAATGASLVGISAQFAHQVATSQAPLNIGNVSIFRWLTPSQIAYATSYGGSGSSSGMGANIQLAIKANNARFGIVFITIR